jgi:hypothetical protein
MRQLCRRPAPTRLHPWCPRQPRYPRHRHAPSHRRLIIRARHSGSPARMLSSRGARRSLAGKVARKSPRSRGFAAGGRARLRPCRRRRARSSSPTRSERADIVPPSSRADGECRPEQVGDYVEVVFRNFVASMSEATCGVWFPRMSLRFLRLDFCRECLPSNWQSEVPHNTRLLSFTFSASR